MKSILNECTTWRQSQENTNDDQSHYEPVIDPILMNMSHAKLDCRGESVVTCRSNFPSQLPNTTNEMKHWRKTGDDLALLEAEKFSVRGQKRQPRLWLKIMPE